MVVSPGVLGLKVLPRCFSDDLTGLNCICRLSYYILYISDYTVYIYSIDRWLCWSCLYSMDVPFIITSYYVLI